jgi:hypothetical protein
MIQGATASTTITVESIDGFDLSIGMTAAVPTNVANFLIANLSSNVVTPASFGKAETVLTVTSTTGTPAGTYQVMLSSSGGTRSHALAISVTVGPEDFRLLANPSSLTIAQGQYNTTTITVASEGGFDGNVSLTVTAPMDTIGVAGGPSPVHVIAGGSATSALAIDVTSATAPGTYTVTVTGTSGGLTHTIDIVVRVVAVVNPMESLSLDSYSFVSGTNVTLFIRNFGTVSTTLVSYYVVDSSGNQWARVSWTGPTINANAVVPTNILIGSSCPSCTYSGATGAFTQFNAGNSYSIKIVTARNNQFTFTITR